MAGIELQLKPKTTILSMKRPRGPPPSFFSSYKLASFLSNLDCFIDVCYFYEWENEFVRPLGWSIVGRESRMRKSSSSLAIMPPALKLVSSSS